MPKPDANWPVRVCGKATSARFESREWSTREALGNVPLLEPDREHRD